MAARPCSRAALTPRSGAGPRLCQAGPGQAPPDRGLWLRRRWAEYLTVIVTGSFIPLEIYEIVEHFTVLRVVVLAVNVAIVIYLVLDLRRERHQPRARRRRK
jgi:hypothetical protein